VVDYVEPTEEALVRLAGEMRPVDRREVMLSHGQEPEAALRMSVAVSVRCLMAVDERGPLAVFGVGGSALSSTGSPWMLGSIRLASYNREFARVSRPIVRWMRKDFERLENWVSVDNMVSIRWLRSCGFILEPAVPYGVAKTLFHRFHMEGDP
jgi:hypothetical protein